MKIETKLALKNMKKKKKKTKKKRKGCNKVYLEYPHVPVLNY